MRCFYLLKLICSYPALFFYLIPLKYVLCHFLFFWGLDITNNTSHWEKIATFRMTRKFNDLSCFYPRNSKWKSPNCSWGGGAGVGGHLWSDHSGVRPHALPGLAAVPRYCILVLPEIRCNFGIILLLLKLRHFLLNCIELYTLYSVFFLYLPLSLSVYLSPSLHGAVLWTICTWLQRPTRCAGGSRAGSTLNQMTTISSTGLFWIDRKSNLDKSNIQDCVMSNRSEFARASNNKNGLVSITNK